MRMLAKWNLEKWHKFGCNIQNIEDFVAAKLYYYNITLAIKRPP